MDLSIGIHTGLHLQWTNHKDEGSARVLPDKRELGGTHQWDHSLLGIPLPRPIPILCFLARSREAGPVPARYPIGSVTTVYNFHTFHCKYSPCPELAVTQRFGEHRDSGNFPGFRSPCTNPKPEIARIVTKPSDIGAGLRILLC